MGRKVWICPNCGARRYRKFSPFHYPADTLHEFCGGTPVESEEPEHEDETKRLARESRRREQWMRRQGSNGDGR